MSASKRPKILIVDDEVGIRTLLAEILTDEGYAVVVAEDADSAWEIRGREQLSLILLDIWMPEKDGLTLLKQWHDAGLRGVPIVIMSGHATIDVAVEAVKLGAKEILEKPIAASRLLPTLERVLQSNEAEKGSPVIQRTNFGRSDVMQKFKADMFSASADSAPVLFVGPPNAGAVFYAQMLAPPGGEIVYIDHGSQLESELEQTLRRASSGMALVRLLDSLNPVQQSGLMGLIKEAPRQDTRVAAVAVDDPKTLEKDRGFSRALLGQFKRVIQQPPLVKYMRDIPYTADLITRHLADRGDMTGRRLTPAAVEVLAEHPYENDFMELFSIVRRALMYSHDKKVDRDMVQMAIDQLSAGMKALIGSDIFSLPLRDARAMFEKEYLNRLMKSTRGNVNLAVQISGMDRTYLYRKLKHLKKG